jgi:hypothetical protein
MDGYKEVFGVSPEEDPALNPEDGEEREAGAGAKEQEVTEPAGETKEGKPPEEEASAEGEPSGEKPDENTPAEQTPEERHRQAGLRRQREESARQEATKARIDKIYADMFRGQTDPFTGKPITSEAEYLSYKAADERKKQEETLSAAGIKPETIEKLVDARVAQHPDVQRAQQAIAAANQERARAAGIEAQKAITAELQRISTVDPDVKSLHDIANMPTAPAFNRYVQQGLSLEDAFYLANRKDIETRRQAASRQAAVNQAKGKDHLNPAEEAGKGEVTVPADAAREYRAMMPDATDEQIKKDYLRYLKDTGKR